MINGDCGGSDERGGDRLAICDEDRGELDITRDGASGGGCYG